MSQPMDYSTDKKINVLNERSMKHFNISLQSSNLAAHCLLKDAWRANDELLNEGVVKRLIDSSITLLKKPNTSMGHTKLWKSSLNTLTDPLLLFKKNLPHCGQCSNDVQEVNVHEFHKCKCKLDLFEQLNSQNSNPSVQQKYGMNKYNPPMETSQDSIYSTEDNSRMPCRQVSIQPKPATKLLTSKPFKVSDPETMSYPDIDLARDTRSKNILNTNNEEEESKAHKSNVAKITFKTAKEQLLSSNPAARRTLGASRKAQGKFVSPMIGAQENKHEAEPTTTDERLKNIDPKMIELIENEIIDKGTPIGWDDIAGLQMAKSVIQEAVVWPLLRPDIFTGLRRPPKGILLFGPPGTGKTLIGKCVAAQCQATFFSISASSLTSKWIGDGEKMVRALFAVAACHQPAVIFIDEIDSLLTQRSDSEHEATRRIKTEFLVQFDGAATGEDDRILIVGATNRPQELDEAARRRLVKRLYVPLPDLMARQQIISNLLRNETNDLLERDVGEIARLTDGYSGADMKSLCSEAAMGPIRSVPLSQIVSIDRDQVRPVNVQDFINALQRVRPSVSQDDLGQYVKWNKTFGQGF